jgi:nucleoside-triphosphatase
MKNILIRGRPGSGKTTLIIKIVNSLRDKTAGGFYTQEIRAGKDRVGFAVKTLNGKEGVLSHEKFKTGPRVGKYKVDINVIDKLIVSSIEDAIRDKDIVIIDEIGKMEMFSENFKSAVKKALDSPKMVLATIPVYSNSFLESIKARNDVEILNLDMNNRDRLVEDILKHLKNGYETLKQVQGDC